jgi:hypothetical protein
VEPTASPGPQPALARSLGAARPLAPGTPLPHRGPPRTTLVPPTRAPDLSLLESVCNQRFRRLSAMLYAPSGNRGYRVNRALSVHELQQKSSLPAPPRESSFSSWRGAY